MEVLVAGPKISSPFPIIPLPYWNLKVGIYMIQGYDSVLTANLHLTSYQQHTVAGVL